MIAPPVVPTLPCKAPEYRTVGRFPEASCESRVTLGQASHGRKRRLRRRHPDAPAAAYLLAIARRPREISAALALEAT